MEIKNFTNPAVKEKSCNFNYEPPRIEVVEVAVEKGFADSATDFGQDAW